MAHILSLTEGDIILISRARHKYMYFQQRQFYCAYITFDLEYYIVTQGFFWDNLFFLFFHVYWMRRISYPLIKAYAAFLFRTVDPLCRSFNGFLRCRLILHWDLCLAKSQEIIEMYNILISEIWHKSGRKDAVHKKCDPFFKPLLFCKPRRGPLNIQYYCQSTVRWNHKINKQRAKVVALLGHVSFGSCLIELKHAE